MKNYILALFLLLGLSTTGLAQRYKKGAMQIRLRNKQLLTVVIDGRHFAKYGSSLTVADLPPGMHRIKVYEYYPSNHKRYSSFRDNRAHAVLAYQGKIQITPGSMYYCTVDADYNTMSIKESRTVTIDRNEQSYHLEQNFVFDDEASELEYNRPDRRFEGPDNDPTISYYGNNDNNRLNAKDMHTLKSGVDDYTSSNEQEKFVRRYLSNKTMMTEQVLSIMSWFSFESNKLNIAKMCYPKVLDPENYLAVSRALSFSASKEELEEEIFSYKNNPGNRKADNYKREPRTKNNFLQATEMDDLKRSVKEKITDTDKQKLMMQFLNENKFSCNQLMQMLDWLTFEGSRLEFSKWSFERITDKENFAQVKSKFSFSSSKRAIDDMLMP